jgi:hypothetical protein
VDVNLAALDRPGKLALLTTGEVVGERGASSFTGTSPGRDQQVVPGSQDRQGERTGNAGGGSAGVSHVNGIEMLRPEAGVVFRIQLTAVKDPIYAGSFFEGSPVFRNVRVEKIDGLHKYTVGPFSSYEEAEQLKDRINLQTPVSDAFIVAYRDGRRVPVEDVL